jgi:hypothetical protein
MHGQHTWPYSILDARFPETLSADSGVKPRSGRGLAQSIASFLQPLHIAFLRLGTLGWAASDTISACFD